MVQPKGHSPLKIIGELQLIEAIRKRFKLSDESVLVGIGDDASCIKVSQDNLIVTTDTMTEGVHFLRHLFTPYQIGYKLTTSSLSDVYAMNGIPRWAVLSLSLPEDWSFGEFEMLLQGIEDATMNYGISLVGGDLSASKKALTLSMTVLGTATDIVRRDTAKVGDRLYLTGPVGEAALGLQVLKRINRSVDIERGEKLPTELPWEYIEPLLRRFLLPDLINPAELEVPKNAMIDVSDGLFLDLYRLCRESITGARIYEERLPVTGPMKRASEYFGLSLEKAIFSGGEDYQYLIASPVEITLEGLHMIGEVVEEEITIVRKDGSIEPIQPEGYQHFVDN